MHPVFLSGNECRASESGFVVDGADSKASGISLKGSKVYLSIDMKYMDVITKGSTRGGNQKCYILREFSACVGPWFSEQWGLTCLHKLILVSVKTKTADFFFFFSVSELSGFCSERGMQKLVMKAVFFAVFQTYKTVF